VSNNIVTVNANSNMYNKTNWNSRMSEREKNFKDRTEGMANHDGTAVKE
jgi:uncharacterized protein YaiI (UPF0178 family)